MSSVGEQYTISVDTRSFSHCGIKSNTKPDELARVMLKYRLHIGSNRILLNIKNIPKLHIKIEIKRWRIMRQIEFWEKCPDIIFSKLVTPESYPSKRRTG